MGRFLTLYIAIMVLAIIAVLILISFPVHAHDSWISSGAFRNAAGEWCCGEGDCAIVDAKHVSTPIPGYRLPSGEFIIEREAQPSPDGKFWRCKRPDGSRRCFFAPIESE